MNKNISANDTYTREFTKADNVQMQLLINCLPTFTKDDLRSYGVAQQKKLAEISNELFKEAKNIDSSITIECIENITKSVISIDKKYDLISFNVKKSYDLLNELKQEYATVFKSIDINLKTLSKELENYKNRVALYYNLKEINIYYINQLGIYIKAGEKWLANIKGKIHNFERKIKDLRLSRQISIDTIKQIDKISSADKALIDIITKSFENIKAWKNQVNEFIYITEEAKGATL